MEDHAARPKAWDPIVKLTHWGVIALHLAGVVFETRRSGREIVGSMIPGGNRRN